MRKPSFLLALLFTIATISQAQSPATGQRLGHDYVDLGLSVMWATCNIGANSPSDYGDYFAWGEAEIKASYTKENSVTYGKTSYTFLDVATAQWGSAWRMPTDEECKELLYNCKWLRSTVAGHEGYKITGPNGNSIFFPASGIKDGTSTIDNEKGCVWSSSRYQSDLEKAVCIYSDATQIGEGYASRCDGLPVRPIVDMLSEKETRIVSVSGQISGHNYVDLGLSVKWATCNIGASKPEDHGDYFAWGEAETKTDYSDKNSVNYKKKNYVFRDAAKLKWGSTWRVPTLSEFQELIDHCTWQWTTVGGLNGYRVTSKKNGKSIFLPAAGGHLALVQYIFDKASCYWTSSPCWGDDKNESAYGIFFCVSMYEPIWEHRSSGLPVRPVTQ